MTDLEQFQAGRDAALVARFVRRIEPTYGFVLYAIIWVSFSMWPAGIAIFGFVELCKALGVADGSPILFVGFIVLSIGGVIVGWIPFVIWVRRKRGRARTLIRDGRLCEARVETSGTDRATQLAVRMAVRAAGGHLGGAIWERVVFEHGGARYSGVAPFPTRVPPGTPSYVLFAPESKYALAFAPNGHAYVTRARRE